MARILLYHTRIPGDGSKRPDLAARLSARDHLLRFALSSQGLVPGPDLPPMEKGPFGKPYIPSLSGFHFSYSDSGRQAVLAVSDEEIGADIQKITGIRKIDALAARYFPPQDASRLLSETDPDKKTSLFVRLWTIREAYLKYTGDGFTKGPGVFYADIEKKAVYLPGETGSLAFLEFPKAPADEYLLTLCAGTSVQSTELIPVPDLPPLLP